MLADKGHRNYITVKEYKDGTARVLWDSTGEEEKMGRRTYKNFEKMLKNEGIWHVEEVTTVNRKRKRGKKRQKKSRRR